jgi:quinol monooxygenase YgiN
MLIVLAEATLGDGTLDEGRAALTEMIERSRKEERCLGYSYAVDVIDPSKLVVVEKWADQAALDYHFQTLHMAAFQKALGELDITVTELKKYQADDGAPLR